MARRARLKVVGVGAWYHLYSRVAGRKGEYPLGEKRSRRKLVELIKFYSRVYFMDVGGFAVMGNHYHLAARFEEPRDIERDELYRRALLLYKKTLLNSWGAEKWERFRTRLFDVSELMRNLQAAFARWYNAVHQRKGRFWGDRFKSTLLENEKEALECLLYIELNPVRAGLVERPEQYEGSSLYLREARADRWMIPMRELVPAGSRKAALRGYKAAIYYRGSVPTKEGQQAIAPQILKEAEASGFAGDGAYRKRLRHFVDGVVIGSEEFVRGHLDALRETGDYLRRRHPLKIPNGAAGSHILKEQRTTEVFLG